MFKKLARIITATTVVTTLLPACLPVGISAAVANNVLIMDTYADSTDGGAIRGTQEIMYVHNRGGDNQARVGYMMLSLPGLETATIDSATLTMQYIGLGSHPVSSGVIQVEASHNANWDQADLTWNNRGSTVENEPGWVKIGRIRIKAMPETVTLDDTLGLQDQGPLPNDPAAPTPEESRLYYPDLEPAVKTLTEFFNEDPDKRITLKFIGDSRANLGTTDAYNRYQFSTTETKTGDANKPKLTVNYTASTDVGSVTVSPKTVELWDRVDTKPVQLSTVVGPPEALNKTLNWTTSDNAVATVSQTGLVTPVGPGTTTITATSTDGTNVSDTCEVTVKELLGDPVTIPILEDTYVDKGNPNSNFDSRNYILARADGGLDYPIYLRAVASGIMQGKVVANAKLYMKLRDTKFGDIPPGGTTTTGGTLSVQGLKYNRFDVSTLTYATTPSILGFQECGNMVLPNEFDEFAEIDVTEYVASMGDQTLAFKINGDSSLGSGVHSLFYASESDGASHQDGPFLRVAFRENTVPVTGIELDTPSKLMIDNTPGNKLTATISPADASDKRVAWSSSNPAVATVNNFGHVTPVSAGSAVITATAVNGGVTGNSASCNIQVLAGNTVMTGQDTFISGAAQSDTNNLTFLYARRNTQNGTAARYSFIEVDLSDQVAPGQNVNKAELCLFYFNASAIPVANRPTIDKTVRARYIDNTVENTWDETTLTWTNAPGATSGPFRTPPDTVNNNTLYFDIYGYGYENTYAIDITSVLNNDEDKIFTIGVLGVPDGTDTGFYAFHSKEATAIADGDPVSGTAHAPYVRFAISEIEYTYTSGAWVEGEDVTVTLNVDNGVFGEAESAMLLFAIYKKDNGQLVRVGNVDFTSIGGATSTSFTSTITDLPSGSEDDYTMKVFVWDSIAGMQQFYTNIK